MDVTHEQERDEDYYQNLNRPKTLSYSELPHQPQQILEEPDVYDRTHLYTSPSIFRGPPKLITLLIGLLYMVVAAVYTAALLVFYLYAAVVVAIIMPFVLAKLSPRIWACAYRKWEEYQDVDADQGWHKPLRRVVFACALFAGAGTCAAGYFYRELYVADHGSQVPFLVSMDTPNTSFGTALRFTGPNGQGQGIPARFKSASIGNTWPVCAAPIVTDENDQKEVSYWAVGHGDCCNSGSCDGWASISQQGGYRLEYVEAYPELDAAVKRAVSQYGLISQASAVYVRYGDVNSLKKDLRNYTIFSIVVGFSVGFITAVCLAFFSKY